MATSLYRNPLTIGLLASIVAIAFEAMAVTTALTVAARELGNDGLYAWTFTAFALAQTVAIVLTGQLVDRGGPLLPLIIGVSLFALGLVTAATAAVMGQLLIARALQGFGSGMMNLVIMVIVPLAYDERERPHLMTAFSTAWVAPALVGPAIAAWIATSFSWHWVFWAVLPLLAFGVLMIARPVLEVVRTHPTQGKPMDVRLVLLAFALAIAAAVIQAAGQWLTVWTATGAAVALIVIGVGFPRLMPGGFTWLGDGLSAVVLTRALLMGAFFGTQIFLTPLLTHARGVDLVLAGIVITISSIGWTFGAWLHSRHWLPFSRDVLISIGALVMTLGMGVVALGAWLEPVPVWVTGVGFAAAGCGVGIASASLSLALMDLSLQAELGHNTSSLQVAEALGTAVAAGLGGTLVLVSAAGPQAYGLAMTAMALLGLLGIAFSRRIGSLQNFALAHP